MVIDYYSVTALIILCVVLWYLSNHKYIKVSKLIRRTRSDVEGCIRDIDILKSDMDRVKSVILSIDAKITQIEGKIKNI